ncbi:hypothetical protein JHK85_054481 [Glycine max]|nr:hypothetical protein JHK85_054481 [Glycine max]
MRDKGVKKTPGHSLIEIDGEFKEFLVADESHARSEEIYEVLDEIFLLSKSEDCDCELQLSADCAVSASFWHLDSQTRNPLSCE